MSAPGFTGQASIFRSRNRYQVNTAVLNTSPQQNSFVPAYPLPETMRQCRKCQDNCLRNRTVCEAGLAWGCAFGPLGCAAAWAACEGYYALCLGACHLPDFPLSPGECCPVPCSFGSFFESLFDPGVNCCDYNETCVDRNDPNSRYGCCPADQIVCGGNCCAKGERCCGTTCCPTNHPCCNGQCCGASDMLCVNGHCGYPDFGPYIPAPPSEKPTPPVSGQCPPGRKLCGADKCCRQDQYCCGGPGAEYCSDGRCVN